MAPYLFIINVPCDTVPCFFKLVVNNCYIKHMNPTKKGKGIPYLLLSFGPGADCGLQAFSSQVTDYKSSAWQ